MKSTFKNLFAPLLAILALTTTAFGQLQWSSYDKTGTLVTANVASGGDSTYGGSVTFSIPAATQLEFLTKTFAPMNTPSAGNAALVTFNIAFSGGLSGLFLQTYAVTVVTASGSLNAPRSSEVFAIESLTGAVAGGIAMFAVGFIISERSKGGKGD